MRGSVSAGPGPARGNLARLRSGLAATGCLLAAASLAQAPAGAPAVDESLSAPPAFDADAPPRTPRPEPPAQEVDVPAGEPVLDGPAAQEVRIIRRDDAEVTEFRDGGVLRAVRVKPDVGPVYYLVDTDGDGDLETRTDGPREGLAIPMWIIARW